MVVVFNHNLPVTVFYLEQFGCLLSESALTLTNNRPVLDSSSHLTFTKLHHTLEWSFFWGIGVLDLCSSFKTLNYHCDKINRELRTNHKTNKEKLFVWIVEEYEWSICFSLRWCFFCWSNNIRSHGEVREDSSILVVSRTGSQCEGYFRVL